MNRTVSSEQLLSALLLLALMGAVAAMMAQAGTSPSEALLRYTLVALIATSIAPTHVLLPDPSVPWLVRTNPSPGRLLARTLSRFLPSVTALILPAIAMGWILGGVLPAITAVLLIVAASGYAFHHVLAIGPISQAWQEGTRGETYRRIIARSPNASFQVPHGLVPPMLASIRIFLVGTAMVFVVGVVQLPSVLAGLIGAGILVSAFGWRIHRSSLSFDRALYQSSALFTELLHSPTMRAGSRDPISIEAVYWVPKRWRAHAWAGLLQLDRRVPMGRLFVLSAILFWGMIAAGASPTTISFFLLAAIVGRSAATVRHRRADMSPPAFTLAWQGPADWIATRFWMGTRWTLPFILVLSLTAMFSGILSWEAVLLWTVVDIVVAGISAIFATLTTEYAHRRRFA